MFLPRHKIQTCFKNTVFFQDEPTDADVDVDVDADFDDKDITAVETNEETSIIDIATNPIKLFIFVALYSLWFGGFTRSQLHEHMFQKKKNENSTDYEN